MYAQYSEPAAKIPSHRMLAIRRGAKEGVLTFEIEVDRQKPITWLRGRVVRAPGEWVPTWWMNCCTTSAGMRCCS